MKREIKFRAWDKENGCWASIDSVALCDDGSVAYLLSADGEPPYLEEEVEIMQYTGLDDVNGKPIYEGDIVKVVSQYWGQLGNRYEVKFRKGAFCVKYSLLSEISRSTLVIGNVHTNPELLEDMHNE